MHLDGYGFFFLFILRRSSFQIVFLKSGYVPNRLGNGKSLHFRNLPYGSHRKATTVLENFSLPLKLKDYYLGSRNIHLVWRITPTGSLTHIFYSKELVFPKWFPSSRQNHSSGFSFVCVDWLAWRTQDWGSSPCSVLSLDGGRECPHSQNSQL